MPQAVFDEAKSHTESEPREMSSDMTTMDKLRWMGKRSAVWTDPRKQRWTLSEHGIYAGKPGEWVSIEWQNLPAEALEDIAKQARIDDRMTYDDFRRLARTGSVSFDTKEAAESVRVAMEMGIRPGDPPF